MSTPSLQNVFDAVRSYLNDTQVSGGEIFTNTKLQPLFAENYRTLWNRLMGVSKRVERTVVLNFPANTTVLIPSTYNITDFSEPELIEERQAGTSIAITSTTNATPINCLATAHGLGSAGTMVEGAVSGVAGTPAPWGTWFATVVDANNFTLNGSSGDGNAGTGGIFVPWSTDLTFQEVVPTDFASDLDGVPSTYLGVYLWENERLSFRGATGIQQLRIKYWASGTAPTIPSISLNIDNCLDFLAVSTAASGALTQAWASQAELFNNKAYIGPDQQGGLLMDFVKIQVSTLQRGPQRRQRPFRDRRGPYGNYIIS